MTRARAVAAIVLAVAVEVAGLGATAATGEVAAPPEPGYQRTVDDPVTADNEPVVRPDRGCPPPGGCRLPDTPATGADVPVDSYGADVYERPYAPGSGLATVLPALDIGSARVGIGPEHLYYRIDLAGADADGRPAHAYAFEVDYDVDAHGDLLVSVAGDRLGLTFSTVGVTARWNRNSNLTGLTFGPDGPGGNEDGYETTVLDEGGNRLDGAPGGADAVVARIAPDGSASVEVAVRRALVMVLNDGERLKKVAFRAGASAREVDPSSYTLHDRFGREEAGSPFPFLVTEGASATCPSSDRGLPEAERRALGSGTAVDTGRPNPCFSAAMGLSGYDNTPMVGLDLDDATVGRQPPDVALSATHAGDLRVGDRAVLSLTVRNLGTGPTTGPVTVTDRVPAGLRALSAAGAGWACSTVGATVSCTTRSPLDPGDASTVRVRVAVRAPRPDGVANNADVVTPGDAEPGNNVASDLLRLQPPGRPSVVTVPAGLAGTGVLVLLARARRRRRMTSRSRRAEEAEMALRAGSRSRTVPMLSWSRYVRHGAVERPRLLGDHGGRGTQE